MTIAPPYCDFRYLPTYGHKRAPSTFTPSQQTENSPSGRKPIDPSLLLQDRECDLEYYQTHFCDKKHSNFVAATSAQGPIIISVRADLWSNRAWILIRTSQGSERIDHPLSTVVIPWYRRLFGTHLWILSRICPAVPVGALEPCSHPEFPKALVQLEERQIIQSYKFGIYQLLPGQTLERQGLANPRDTCTPDFMDFVSWLGDPIQLRGWTGYRAGLDVNGDTTGDTSIFTQWNDYQIMFHCAPFMPFNPNDDQQIERRRFIGNDIVIIIFKEKDDDEQFDFTSVRSRQNHVICIVRPKPSSSSSNCKSYRVTIAVKDGIRNFPPTDFPLLLQRDDASRDLLLLKLIAGERAAYKAKAFATQIVRTREALIRDVIEKYR